MPFFYLLNYITHNAAQSFGDVWGSRRARQGGKGRRSACATFVLLFVAVRWRRSETPQLRG